MIANWFENEPITDVRLNQLVNACNSLAIGSSGLVVLSSSGTWVVPDEITSDTRLRVWVQAGGGGTNTSGEAGPGVGGDGGCAFSILTGYSGGQSVPVVVGGAGAPNFFGATPGGPSSFDTTVLTSTGGGGGSVSGAAGSPGGVGGTAPAGVLSLLRWLRNYGGANQPGVVIISW